MQSVFDFINSLGPAAVYIGIVLLVFIVLALMHFFGAGMRRGVSSTMTALGWVLFLIIWSFPLAILLFGWSLPSLHQPATLNIPDSARGAIMILGVIGVIWLMFEILTTQYTDSRSKLIMNVFISGVWTIVFCVFAGFEYGKGNLAFWEVLPAVFSATDLLTGIIAGISAAWNKNPTQVSARL